MNSTTTARLARVCLLVATIPAALGAQAAASPGAASRGAAPGSAAPGSDAITAAKMRADLEFLSGDGFRGRLTDTPENALAL